MLRMLLRSTRIPSPALPTPRDHLRDEDGALTIVGLIFFAVMVLAGGVAWDIMRSERDRADLQYAMDRATLAAAALDQERDPKQVVEDYLNAAGIPHDSVRIQTFKDDERTRVTVHGDARTRSIFMQTLGHAQMEAPVWSQAREEEMRIEVALVLDISGSMGGTKLTNMRSKASDFVAQLLDADDGLTTVSIVPYNDRVNVGPTLASYLPLSTEHDNSNCVVFETDDFKTTGLDSGTVLRRMGQFDWRNGSNAPGVVGRPHCLRNDYGAIMPWSNNVAALQAHIQALGAGDWTAMDLGVKWGAMLLDPSMREEMAAMIADDLVPEEFAGRPFDYDEPRVKKILVVMTDGKNTTQWDLKDYAKNGPSSVFVYNSGVDINVPTANGVVADATAVANAAANSAVAQSLSPVSNWAPGWSSLRGQIGIDDRDGFWAASGRGDWNDWDADNNGSGTAWYTETKYSVWSPTKGQFWLPHTRQWSDVPEGGASAVELSYQELFSNVSIPFIKYNLLQYIDPEADGNDDGLPDNPNAINVDSSTRSHYVNAYKATHGQTSADANLGAICKAAGDEGVIIYTIAFKAPTDGKTAMKDCAGKGREGYFYDVATTDLSQAFDSIIASINLLKLTR